MLQVIIVGYFKAVAMMRCVLIFSGCLSSIANGLGKLNVQAICFGIGAIVKIPLSWILVNLFDSWVGVIWANVISVSVYCFIQPLYIKKILTFKLQKEQS